MADTTDPVVDDAVAEAAEPAGEAEAAVVEREPGEPDPKVEPVPIEELRIAAQVIGLTASDDDLKTAAKPVASNRKRYAYPRKHPLADGGEPLPALRFDPLAGTTARVESSGGRRWRPDRAPRRFDFDPDNDDIDLSNVGLLAGLIRARRVTCRQLTEASLARLAAVDQQLHCLVTLTAERAREAADRLDAELEAGHWRGPLHGLPWGAKDLIDVVGHPTTWGSPVWKDRMPTHDATVVRRLDDAGAVLVAKLATGELAMGDRWFGGQTRNPWHPESGSSGSSAGSGAAVSAGAVAFALGTETYGSIVSPSAVCGCSGLRPTFGRVSRTGVMTLAWTMDKVGPIARTIAPLGPVLAAIIGTDPADPTTVDYPFAAPGSTDVTGWRVGVAESAFEEFELDRHVIDELSALGVELVRFEPPDMPIDEILYDGIAAESASSFDELTRAGRLGELANQDGWPPGFIASRFVPAVEYLRGQRMRTELMVATGLAMDGLDAVVHPTLSTPMLGIGNLTGRPTVAAPCGLGTKHEDGGDVTLPRSISFTGQLYGEERLLALAATWQKATGHHLARPPI